MRIRMLTSIAAVAALALTLSTVPGPPAVASPLAPAPAPAPGRDLATAAIEALGLLDATVAPLDLPAEFNPEMRIDVPVDGAMLGLNLHPVNVRAEGFMVLAQAADGSLVEVEPTPARTVRGTVEGWPGSRVAGSLLDDGLHATVVLPDAGTYWVEPLAGRVPGAGPDDHVIYLNEDAACADGVCGVTDELIAQQPIFDVPADVPADGGIAGTEFYSCTEIGVDADVEFFNFYGSVGAVENRVELVLNTMNLQYETEVDITHIITAIVVRTSEPDPYSSTDPGTLLNQFTNEWNSNQASIPRDVAHLFTGKNLNGGVIGIAWTSTVCTTLAYGLVQHQGILACATDLSAHEIGHNWSANHCSCPTYTMNPSQVNCNNTFHPTETIPEIIAFRISRPCLELCDGEPQTYTPPLFDDFPQTLFDSDKWTGVDGATISFNGIGEPSEPFCANINGSDQLRSAILDASDASLVTLSYWWQRTGNGDSPEASEDLFVEYRLADGATWVVANQHLGDGPDMTTFELASIELPSDAFHDGLRIRFRGTSALEGFDDWFVDDVLVEVLLAPANNNCGSGILIGDGATPFTTIGATTDGPDETPGGCGTIDGDVWFKYINPCEGTVTISVCDADFDTQIAVYQACPGEPDLYIACNDDSCGQQSQVTFAGVPALYRLRVGGAAGATGSGTLNITCEAGAPCPGDCGVVDGTVDIQDLLALLSQWGGGGTCDLSPAGGDGNVDINDLLDLLSAWGPCD